MEPFRPLKRRKKVYNAHLSIEAFVMPQLLFLAAVGAVAWIGYKAFVREAERVTARVRRTERERETGTMGTLVKDPDTGEYRLPKG